MSKGTKPAVEPDCWSLEEWVTGARISRAMFYNIAEELRPAHTRIGRRIIVTEAPRAWLRRMAERGGVQTVAAA